MERLEERTLLSVCEGQNPKICRTPNTDGTLASIVETDYNADNTVAKTIAWGFDHSYLTSISKHDNNSDGSTIDVMWYYNADGATFTSVTQQTTNTDGSIEKFAWFYDANNVLASVSENDYDSDGSTLNYWATWTYVGGVLSDKRSQGPPFMDEGYEAVFGGDGSLKTFNWDVHSDYFGKSYLYVYEYAYNASGTKTNDYYFREDPSSKITNYEYEYDYNPDGSSVWYTWDSVGPNGSLVMSYKRLYSTDDKSSPSYSNVDYWWAYVPAGTVAFVTVSVYNATSQVSSHRYYPGESGFTLPPTVTLPTEPGLFNAPTSSAPKATDANLAHIYLHPTAPIPPVQPPPSLNDHLVVTTQPPSSVPAGTGFPLIFAVQDASGAVDTKYNGPLTVIAKPSIGRPITLNVINGVANASGTVDLRLPEDYDLFATSGGLSVSTSTIHVTAPSEEEMLKQFNDKLGTSFESAEKTAELLFRSGDRRYVRAKIEEYFKKAGLFTQGVQIGWDLGKLIDAYDSGDKDRFGKAFSGLVKDLYKVGVEDFSRYLTGVLLKTLGLAAAGGRITITFAGKWGFLPRSAPGVYGGLFTASLVGESLFDKFYDTYAAPGFEKVGRDLYDWHIHASSVIKTPGLHYFDPPLTSVVVSVPPSGSASQAADITAAAGAVYAPAAAVFSGQVATFSDASGNTSPAAYSALIDWGDGHYTPATVAAAPGGGFSVAGSNTYASIGIYTATAVIMRSDGSTASAYIPVVVFPPEPSGQTSTPTATLIAPDVSSFNADWLVPYTFSLAFQASGLIAVGTLAGSTVQVQPPVGSPLSAQLISTTPLGTKDNSGNASTIVVTYQISPPGGNWHAAPPGMYQVNLAGSPVTDLAGKGIPGGAVGAIQVGLAPILNVSPDLGADPISTAHVSDSASLSLAGLAQAGSTVRVYNGAVLLGTALAGVDGAWSYNYAAPSNGLYHFTATATGALGTSPPSAEAVIDVDTIAPTSQVTALPATSAGTFMLAWSGQDNPGGSGLAAYDVYVSDNGGPVALAVGGTSQTSTMFNGRVGHTYRFYSVATDLAGHRASLPASFDTKTTVTTPPWQNSANPLDVTLDGHVVPGDALAIINYLNAFGPGPVPLGAVDSGPHYDVTGDGTVAPGDALAVINHLNAFGSGEGEEAGARGQEEGDRGQRFGEGGALSDLEMLALLAVDVAGQSRRRGW